MTKTYDLVTLYYKGRSPLKKEDNSYLMCLYTMLFVLFAMVMISLLLTFFNEHPDEKEAFHRPDQSQFTQKIVTSTNKPTTTKRITKARTTYEDLNSYYEETAPPIVDWNEVVHFFVGSESDEDKRETAEQDNTMKDFSSKSKYFVERDEASATNSDKLNLNYPSEFTNGTNEIKASPGPSELREHNHHSIKPEENSERKIDAHEIKNEKETHISPLYTFLTEKDTKPKSEPNKTTLKEDNFIEWPEQPLDNVAISAPALPPEDEVEWVPTLKNLTVKNETAHLEVQKDCESARCKVASSKMLSSIDLTMEPCRNFYSFACGGSNSEKSEQFFPEVTSAKLDFVKKFSWFYESCLNHQINLKYRDRIRSTRRVLFEKEVNYSDITDVFSSLILLDAMPFFNIDIGVSNSKFIFKISPPNRALLSKYWSPLAETRRNCLRTTPSDNLQSPIDITFLYYGYEKCQRNIDYLKSLETAMEELGNFRNLSSKQRENYIKNTVGFVQKDLLKILDDAPSISELQRDLIYLKYTILEAKKLDELFPIINWYKLLRQIGSNAIKPLSVQLYNEAYFQMLFKRLSSFKNTELLDGLTAILAEKYYQELVLPTPKDSRAKYCNKLSRKLLPDISNHLYQKANNNDDFMKQKHYILDIFEEMKENYKTSLSNQKWLDNLSRASMMKKLDNIKLETSSNNISREIIYLNQSYSGLCFKPNDFSFNYKQAMKFSRKKLFSLHGNIVSGGDIFRNFMDQTNDKPEFFYEHNVAYISDSFISKAYLDLPKYLVIAKVGFPLAKIIGHTFDPVGMRFGVYLSSNVSSLYNRFVQETKRTLPHYIGFKKWDLVFSLNPQISEVERIAENSAMGILSNSIEEIQHQALIPLVSFTFSREKIFFMALVQEVCEDMSLMEFVVQAHESPVLPPQFQVQNILQNSEAFYTQFSCRPMTKFPQLQFPHLSVLMDKDSDKIT